MRAVRKAERQAVAVRTPATAPALVTGTPGEEVRALEVAVRTSYLGVLASEAVLARVVRLLTDETVLKPMEFGKLVAVLLKEVLPVRDSVAGAPQTVDVQLHMPRPGRA